MFGHPFVLNLGYRKHLKLHAKLFFEKELMVGRKFSVLLGFGWQAHRNWTVQASTCVPGGTGGRFRSRHSRGWRSCPTHEQHHVSEQRVHWWKHHKRGDLQGTQGSHTNVWCCSFKQTVSGELRAVIIFLSLHLRFCANKQSPCPALTSPWCNLLRLDGFGMLQDLEDSYGTGSLKDARRFILERRSAEMLSRECSTLCYLHVSRFRLKQVVAIMLLCDCALLRCNCNRIFVFCVRVYFGATATSTGRYCGGS